MTWSIFDPLGIRRRRAEREAEEARQNGQRQAEAIRQRKRLEQSRLPMRERAGEAPADRVDNDWLANPLYATHPLSPLLALNQSYDSGPSCSAPSSDPSSSAGSFDSSSSSSETGSWGGDC